jgi:hypothetical protein
MDTAYNLYLLVEWRSPFKGTLDNFKQMVEVYFLPRNEPMRLKDEWRA